MHLETTTLNVLLVSLIALQAYVVRQLHALTVDVARIKARMGLE
jgi:hypothetical protein